MIQLPAALRRLARASLGMQRATAIAPGALLELAARERVVVIGVGVWSPGSTDPRLPGEQRAASLRTLAKVVADLAPAQPIALHCG